MKKMFVLSAFIMLSAMSARSTRAAIVMDVVASPAPNFLESPNWSGYLTNALNSIENGLGEIGNRDVDPAAYAIIPNGGAVRYDEMILTMFRSWRGVADPASPFEREAGNRVHFGVRIAGDGQMRFRLEDLSWEIQSSGGNQLGFTGSFAGNNYSSARIGIDYGADMTKGGNDDVIITSGSATQTVDELIYVGVGNAFDATSQPGPGNQDRINQQIASLSSQGAITVTGSYTLRDPTGSIVLATGSTMFTAVPEPGVGLFLSFLGGARVFRRRPRVARRAC